MTRETLHPAGTPLPPIDSRTDTEDILAHARRQAAARKYQDYVIVDVDSHHTETSSWQEVIEFIEDPVIRDHAVEYHRKITTPAYGLVRNIAFDQDVGGRITHGAGMGSLNEAVEETGVHRDVILSRRAMESMGIDYMVVFPTGMLALGMHPQTEMEVQLARAYNLWTVENLLKGDGRIKSMVYLPFNEPAAALRTVEEFAGKPGVIGFMVTSARNKPVHHNDYMRLYATLQERGLPIAFHGGYSWQEPAMAQFNRFIGVHTMGFVFWIMVHLINWVVNGLPERFPGLKVLWLESGLAWIPFLMQRLDNEYMMRTSEAPMLKRRPSEYMREMFYASQPLEADNLEALELTFKMINAETQLMYASDWPHWDFDLPSAIFDLPFLSERARRNIMGETAMKLFGLDRPGGRKVFEGP